MSKKFFRPPQSAFDDNSDSEDDDEDFDDDDDNNKNKNNNKSKNTNYDDDASDVDDDEDEGATKGKASSSKRKDNTGKENVKKKVKTSSFFDMEAEDSGDDDEEEEGYSRNRKGGASSSKKMDGEVMDEETMAIIRQQDRRRAQGGGLFGQRSVAEISREIEQRHRVQQHRRPVDRSMIMDRPIHDRRPPKGGGGSGGSVAGGRDAANGAGGGRKSGGGGHGGAVDVGGRGSGGGAMVSSSLRDDRDIPRDHDDDVMDEHEPTEVYTAAVAQQSLVPSVSDPSLWMVSCLPGKEQELVFQIMNKCVALARRNTPLGITAAIAAQSKSKIYIESASEPAVLEAIQGVRGLMQYSMKKVPIGDMTTVMTVVSKKKPVRKNEWVRMTRGHYKGDLALVKAVKESGLKCIIQCVPRLDLTLSDLPPEEARIRRRTIRPPQKFFNIQEVTTMGKQTLKRQRFPGLDIYCDYFEGNYYQDGYLLKEMTVGSMVTPCTDEDPPTLDELQSFQRRKQKGSGDDDDDGVEENEGSKVAASLLDELSELQGKTTISKSNASAAESAGLLIGDTVEVIEGDLIGMRGKLISLDGSTVKVKPTNTNIELGGMGEVEFLANQVRKYIPVGAHVKVTDGRYANETGTVVAIEQLEGETDFTAVVLTDVTNKEISVRTSQLRESAEVASGQDKLSGYELYDLVVLAGGGSANEVGVIVRVGREDFTVINNHGLPREVRPEELRGKKNTVSNRAVALDVQGNQIRCSDTVNVAEGPHKGKTATIKRMSRAQLFLHSQTRTDHAGIFVVRSRSCVLAGTRSQSRGSGGDGSGMIGSSPFSTPLSHNSNNRGGPPGGRPGGRKDDNLVGKTVRIQAGQWKGFLGSVVDTTATHVQVELHARLKKVLVVREKVAVIGDKFGATGGGNNGTAMENGTENNPINPMATPMHGPIGGATPAIHSFGGATPSHAGDDNDDVWRPGGSIDQDGIGIKSDDGWGSTSDNNYDSSTKNVDNDDSGWVSSNGGGVGWGVNNNSDGFGSSSNSNTVKNEFPMPAAIKRETIAAAPSLDTNNGDVDDETPVWFMERVCIQTKDGNKTGVIREINPDKSALVEWDGDKTTQTVRVADVAMVAPLEHDTVLVTGGNELGLEGSLVCVDGTDAILKDPNDEFKIIDFVHLVKISSESQG